MQVRGNVFKDKLSKELLFELFAVVTCFTPLACLVRSQKRKKKVVISKKGAFFKFNFQPEVHDVENAEICPIKICVYALKILLVTHLQNRT